MTPLSEQRKLSSVPEVLNRREINVKQHLSLHGMAGALGQGVVMDALGRVTHSLNILGGELWERIKDDNAHNLLELGIHTVMVVRIYSLNLYASIFLSFFHVLTQLVSSFSRSEHPRSSPPSRCDGSKRKNSLGGGC